MSIKFICKRKFTELDNIFIDEYMPEAVPVFSLVYIYALRMASEGIQVTNAEIGEKLGILESDVVKAWKFWKKVGVVKITGVKTEPVIEFCDIKSKQGKYKKQTEGDDANVPSIVPLGAKPVYNPGQVDFLMQSDKGINDLLQIAQAAMGHSLSSNDVSTIVGFYDWLKLPIDVIAVLLTYGSKNSKSMRYIEKIAVSWAEKDIKTAEEAEKQLNYFSNEFREVLGFFGIHNRVASSDEQKHILKWIDQYNMPMQLIKKACEKTIANTGQASFPYAAKIIENWHKSGIKTLDAAEKEDTAYRKGQEGGKAKNIAVKQNSFNGYQQRNYDEDEFDQIVSKKIQ